MEGPSHPLPATVDDAVERSAAPDEVGAAVGRLVATHDGLADRLEDDDLLDALVAVLGASRSLTRLLEHDATAVDVLADLDRRIDLPTDAVPAFVHAKQLEYLRIAARDLSGGDDLEATGAALAQLGIAVLAGADVLATAAEPAPSNVRLAVVGMGKLGGLELNYSSDIDIMFVGDGDGDVLNRRARRIMEIAGQCFRVDANLRPEGRNGPLVRSIESFEAYWDRWAEPWEFQALLKAVPVAGDVEQQDRFADTAARTLWTHPFDTDDLRSLRDMKARAEQEVARKGLTDREVKRGRGGIRDIEFTVQLLQLVHGHLDEDLRSPNTLATLAEMASAGYIDTDDAAQLADSYRFLRVVEHRLQLVDEQQVHTLPTDPIALDRLARTMGRRDLPEGSALEQLDRDVRLTQLRVRTIHERVYFRPLLEAFSHTEGGLSPEAAVTRLQAFGFTDAKRTQAAVRDLTRGLNRSSRMMQQLLPLLLDWLSRSPDPELRLVMLRNLLGAPQRTSVLVEAFRESPDAARALCTVLGTSQLLGDILQHNPDLVSRLPHEARLRTHARAELVASAATTALWRDEATDQQDALRRWKDRNLLGIAARDVLDHTTSVATIGADLTALGEASLEVALQALEPQVPFVVIAMGRFGGAELSYGSDLDVLFAYDGAGTNDVTEARRIATRLLKFLAGSTPARRIYEVDADLRPEGRQGPMARSIEGFQRYWDDYALVWERQAMVRARPVAGDLALGHRLLALLDDKIWGTGLNELDAREIRRLKARIEGERIPAHEDPLFHLKLGRGSLSDIEWTAQLLQLRHGVRATGTWAALDALEAAGHLTSEDADVLRASYRFCERTRNRWFLVKSSAGDALPTQPEQARWLALSLGTTAGQLREEYRRVTRRARRVVERVFYDQP